MSTNNARINPKRREIDFLRLAEAILQLAIDLDDEASREEGRRIQRRLAGGEGGTA